jgi:hypothetical protein
MMDKSEGIQSGKPSGKWKSFNRRNIFVFAFFLCLSFVFWYLNSLGKDQEADIKYPLTYTNFPKDLNQSENIAQKVSLFLSGPGYSIQKMKISGIHPPLVIDLSKVRYKHLQDGKSAYYYILTSDIVHDLNQQLKSGCKVTSIKPDTIFLSKK